MENKRISLFIAFSLLIFSTGCQVIVGKGPIVEKEVPVEAFSGVDVDGSFSVIVEQGTTQSVKVLANENIHQYVKLEVMDDVLYISLEDGNYMNYDLDLKLIVPDLKLVTLGGSGRIELGTFVNLNLLNVNLNGSGDIVSKGPLEVLEATAITLDGSGDVELTLKARDVAATLDGSGDIRLFGTTTKLVVLLDGSGDIEAFDLESLECEATLKGSGSVKVNASRNLNAKLDGSGDIEYRGQPKVNAEIDGSGTIEAD